MNELVFLMQILAVYVFTLLLFYGAREVLAGWMGLLGIMANLFVAKQVTLFGLEVTASDIYAVGLFLTLNLIQEFEGRDKGAKAMKIAFGFQLGFLALAYLHLLLVPNAHDQSQTAFETVLSTYPRVLAASLFTLWLVQKWDLFFFQWMKNSFQTLSFTERNIATLVLSQALDTVLFTVLALGGVAGNLTHIILLSFMIKGLLIAITPLITIPLRRYVIPV